MNFPNTFTTYGLVRGAVIRIGVSITNGEVSDVSRDDTMADYLPADKAPLREWALKSLAWLKAEAEKATKEDLHIRNVARLVADLRASLAELASFAIERNRTALMSESAAKFRSTPEDMAADLRTAYMSDLLNRMAAEMERQATEAATRLPYCCCSAMPHEPSETCPKEAPHA